MYVRFFCFLFLFSYAAFVWAGEDAFDDAQKALFSGRYEEAVERFTPLVKQRPEAALGLSRCYGERGKEEEALRILRASGGHPLLLAELARLASERGNYNAARSQAEAALKSDARQPLARWILAETDRVAGRYDEAEKNYRRLVRYYNTDDVHDPESLRWIGRAAAQSARWNRLPGQFHFLVNELYPGALRLQPDYWPAHYETGLLFLEKHNPAEALEALRAAERINPHAAAIHAALARAWLQQRDCERAEAALNRALEIHPRLPAAWLSKADLAWATLEPAETLAILEQKILPLNDKDEAVLGRLAACYLVLDGRRKAGASSRFAVLEKEILARNPQPGEFYFYLAVQLERHNRQPLVEEYLQKARRCMPKLPGPTAHLGRLYLAMAREEEARPLLKETFAADPFDPRIHNSLNLLEVLDSMPQRQSEHCRLRTTEADALLARYAAEALDEMYPKLCRRFGYTPPRKAPVDIFRKVAGQSGHAWFSTRVSGLPFVGTVAASTGHLVAMVSPNDGAVRRRFNWVRVLRHELTHVITLQQTNFNIPHWFTEGLAVWCEQSPRPAAWNQLLLKRVPEGDIFNLKTIDSGFTRPHSSDRWHLAYCQAELYVDYMRKLGGEESLRKMLAAYAAGSTTTEAIAEVFQQSEEKFEKGYSKYIEKETAGLHHLVWPEEKDLKSLRQAVQENPDDAAAAAQLAYRYVQRGALPEAEKWAAKAQTLQPNEPLAAYVLARLWVKAGKPPRAIELLEKRFDPAAPQPNALNLLAGLKLKAGDFAEAARLYALGEKLDAVDPHWTRSLVRVYLASGEKDKLEAALVRLARDDPDELGVRLKLAEMALKRKDYAAAGKWARQALEIDVNSAEVHRVLAESCLGRHNNVQAIAEYEIAMELDRRDPALHLGLAEAYLRTGEKVQARQAVDELLKIAPEHPGAEALLQRIESAEEK